MVLGTLQGLSTSRLSSGPPLTVSGSVQVKGAGVQLADLPGAWEAWSHYSFLLGGGEAVVTEK